ncbi:peptidoglycan-binding protein [Labrys sp. KNU-23]|uniref:peptidoglycan-binding protein n=1 Tax=Labrys sp. KNU-23 TaxID=2789216 RepID=UPI001AED65DB|nr:peptidoglycan-binding protein [Labrys sp. KNU-23]
MIALLGNPRGNYSQDCQPVTNPALKARMKTVSVGPFKATGFDLALEALKAVMADIKKEQPNVHAALGTAGMLCCRHVRGSNSSISNHAWGTAIDLTINGVLDPRGDNKVQFGLTLIAPIFNRHLLYWGAGFPTEDGMHFEASLQLLRQWRDSGKLFGGVTELPDDSISFGDRGAEVVALQKALNAGGEKLETDGIFGSGTRAAVVAFQARNGLAPDGIVGVATRKKLGIAGSPG